MGNNCSALSFIPTLFFARFHRVIVNCAKGKDRTGLVCALVSLKVGVPREEVVEAYASSEDLLREGGYVDGEERKGGMDWGRLRGSPPKVMEEIIDWLDKEYGSIENYLNPNMT